MVGVMKLTVLSFKSPPNTTQFQVAAAMVAVKEVM